MVRPAATSRRRHLFNAVRRALKPSRRLPGLPTPGGIDVSEALPLASAAALNLIAAALLAQAQTIDTRIGMLEPERIGLSGGRN